MTVPDTGHGVRLLIADVDGTLVTSAKTLAPSTIEAARTLKEHGVALAITSSRPPRGLRRFIEALEIDTPTAAFNGGVFVTPDLSVLDQSVLPAAVAAGVVTTIAAQGLDVWGYTGDDWYVQDAEGPHVAREQKTIGFAPKVIGSYEPVMDRLVKIVGVSDDTTLMAQAERATRDTFAGAVSASRSQTYYLDVTHPSANKGNVVAWLSAFLAVAHDDIATIGDGPNDILMFRQSGLSIAMGNAAPEVKAEAMVVTSSNDEDGFARAVDAHILSKG